MHRLILLLPLHCPVCVCCISISILSIYRRISKLIFVFFSLRLQLNAFVEWKENQYQRIWGVEFRRFYKSVWKFMCGKKSWQFRFYGKTDQSRRHHFSIEIHFARFAFVRLLRVNTLKHVIHFHLLPALNLLTWRMYRFASRWHTWFSFGSLFKSDCSSLSHHLSSLKKCNATEPCTVMSV